MLINKDLYEKASNITMTDYINNKKYNNGESYVYLDDYSMITLIEDLLSEIDSLQEKYEDLEQDIEDNYIHRPMSNYTGDSYDDRF